MISCFDNISLNHEESRESFVNIVRYFCNMQISNISDYEWAYDISPKMLKILAEAQLLREIVHRSLERSMHGVLVIRDEVYVDKIIDKCSDFLSKHWFCFDDKNQLTITQEGKAFKRSLLELKELISSGCEISKTLVIE